MWKSFVFVANALFSTFSYGQATGLISAGQYEQLMLANTVEGRLVGHFASERGVGVTFSCNFHIEGTADPKKAAIRAWFDADESFKGTISRSKDGVILNIPDAKNLPGCGMEGSGMELSKGMNLSLTRLGPWTDIRKVVFPTVHFYSNPNFSTARKTRLVKGDLVAVISSKSGWLQVEYAGGGTVYKGWIPSESTREFK